MKQGTYSEMAYFFTLAKILNYKYVAVKIEMNGFTSPEIIINPIENVDEKLAYYKQTYDENLVHRHAKGIRIVDFSIGSNFDTIQKGFEISELENKGGK